jgi:hypothetical protein
MSKIQEKLKETIEKQSMKSLERLTDLFDASQGPQSTMDVDGGEEGVAVDALETVSKPLDLKGENKIPTKKGKKRKHAIKAEKPKRQQREKRRPKFFCQF